MQARLPGAATSLALALLVGGPAAAQTTGTRHPPTTTTTTTVTQNGTLAESFSSAPGANALLATMHTDAQAMGLLHRSNVGEIDAGMLAEQRAHDADVKAFAERMVRDHTTLDAQGSSLAARLGLMPVLPDSTLPDMQAREMRRLNMVGTAPASRGAGRYSAGAIRPDSGPVNGTGAGSSGSNGAAANNPPARTDTAGIPGGASQVPTTRADRGAVAASAGGAMGTDASGRPVPAASGTADASFDLAYMRSQVIDHERTLALIDAAVAQTQNADLRTALQSQVRPQVASHLEMAQTIYRRLGGR